jgi:hypothetical protein
MPVIVISTGGIRGAEAVHFDFAIVETPTGRRRGYTVQGRFRNRPYPQAAIDVVVRLKQNFIVGDIEMLMQESYAEAAQLSVLPQNFGNVLQARFIRVVKRRHFVKVGKAGI